MSEGNAASGIHSAAASGTINFMKRAERSAIKLMRNEAARRRHQLIFFCFIHSVNWKRKENKFMEWRNEYMANRINQIINNKITR